MPEIDGLRALAVICVVLFHLELGPFTGGFIGVDVFFVISGFLITRLVVEEIKATGTFSFPKFYARRARRLLPALFFIIALSAFCAFLLFSPGHLERFAKSMLSATGSVSNISFWKESGYFDEEAITKPLLHTWSLGVEEQFYLFWPVFLAILFFKGSGKVAFLGISIAGIISLSLRDWVLNGGTLPWPSGLIKEGASAAFFLTPFRVFEFAIGALVVWAARFQVAGTIFTELALLSGLVMIVLSAIVYTDQTVFTNLYPLVPCLGAAFVVYAAGRAPLVGWLLRNRIAVSIGLISYSIYLIHWPLIVFWSYYKFAPLSEFEKLWLCAITLLGAALMYRAVELPFRSYATARRWRPRYVAAITVSAALVLSIPAGAMWLGSGLEWRLPKDRVLTSGDILNKQMLEQYCKSFNPAIPRSLVTCQNYKAAANDIFIWGDSHALHLIAGFSEAYPSYNVYVLFMGACVAQSGFGGYIRKFADPKAENRCIERNAQALKFFAQHRPSYVILSNAKRGNPAVIAKPTLLLLNELQRSGHHAFAIADFIRPGVDMRSCRGVPAWLLSDELLRSRCAANVRTANSEISYNRVLSQNLTSDLVDILQVQCPLDSCIYEMDGSLIFRDSHHLTTEGAILLIDRLKPTLPIRGTVPVAATRGDPH
jgi:peptidoglycan/LPS O-acetylase OafA/YrhL